MRLSELQIRQICQKVLLTLRSKQLINLKKTDVEVLAQMESIFHAELRIEDDINREAEKLLQQYASKMSGNVDRQKMFDMIKKQLLKDRNVVV